jgi:hypothetical protein
MFNSQSFRVSLNKEFQKIKKIVFKIKFFGEITSIEEKENQLLFCHFQ